MFSAFGARPGLMDGAAASDLLFSGWLMRHQKVQAAQESRLNSPLNYVVISKT